MTRTPQCPTCRKEISWQGNVYRPFCSARCKMTDLGAWAAESYRIPGYTIEKEQLSDSEREETNQPSPRKK